VKQRCVVYQTTCVMSVVTKTLDVTTEAAGFETKTVLLTHVICMIFIANKVVDYCYHVDYR